MDAFSVSLANGMNEKDMSLSRQNQISFVFAAFQAVMPFIGWFCVHSIVSAFNKFQPFIPWIALILLVYIGGKMILEAKTMSEETETKKISLKVLIVQGIATSIDALSVGFTISNYNVQMALWACLIIGAVTFVICCAGIQLGKKFGMLFSKKAAVAGGILLIFIGIEIFMTSFM